MAYLTKLSNTTTQRRSLLKSLQDDFTTFSWGGYDAFDNFGAFIINDKNGSLKFYNGPGFSNEYVKPQFDTTGGFLQGVTFNKQQIAFTIGVYWISIEDYRKLLHWLSPLKTDYLQFGFDKNYRYDAKLAKIADSTRWVIGREDGSPRYYTELQLTFDVQGTPCAKGIHPYEFRGSLTGSQPLNWLFSGETEVVGKCFLYNTNEFIPSDLETPIKARFQLNLQSEFLEANYFFNTDHLAVLGDFNESEFEVKIHPDYASFFDGDDEKEENNQEGELVLNTVVNNHPTEYDITLAAEYESEKIVLCSLTLQDLAVFAEEGKVLNFLYVSETGLVFLEGHENETGNLLTLQTYTDSGGFLVKSLFTSKFMLPGALDYPSFYGDLNKIQFSLTFKKRVWELTEDNVYAWVSKPVNYKTYNQAISIECFPRTNVI